MAGVTIRRSTAWFWAVAAGVAVTAGCGAGGSVVAGREPGGTARTSTSARICGWDAPTVTVAVGESLHPGWLPTGLVLSSGDETSLSSGVSMLDYAQPGGGDKPRIALNRYLTHLPLQELTSSATHVAIQVASHPALLGTGGPGDFVSVTWSPTDGAAIVASGYKLDALTVEKVADYVVYTPSTRAPLPTRLQPSVTRAKALAAISGGRDAVLSSAGEVATVARIDPTSVGAHPLDPTLSPQSAVWLVSSATQTSVVDGSDGRVLRSWLAGTAGWTAAMPDRSAPAASCGPPPGVLTRSEAAATKPSDPDTHLSVHLVTEADLDRASPGSAQCGLTDCNPDDLLWVFTERFSDGHLARSERPGRAGLRADTPPPPPGSWRMSARPAWTGPDPWSGNPGYTAGPGNPPPAIDGLPDLDPSKSSLER